MIKVHSTGKLKSFQEHSRQKESTEMKFKSRKNKCAVTEQWVLLGKGTH